MATRTILSSGRAFSAVLAAFSGVLLAAACTPVVRDFGDTGGGSGNVSSSGTTGEACEPGTTAPCFDGPMGAGDVGTCKSGTKTCGDDGTYGACEGQVLPAVDDCMTPEDEDCDGSNAECAPLTPLWATGNSTDGDDNNSQAIAVDLDGNIIVAGSFSGMIAIGGVSLSPSGTNGDIFVVKLNPQGETIWAKQYGNADGGQDAVAVAVDPTGKIFVTGNFSPWIDFGNGYSFQTPSGNRDLFILELSPSGDTLNAVTSAGIDGEYATGIAIDNQGRIVVTGTFYSPFTFNGGSQIGDATPSGTRLFVARFDGSLLNIDATWTSGSGDVEPAALAVGPAGSVVVCGWFGGDTSFPGSKPIYTSNGKQDAFLLKLDDVSLSGNWVRIYGGLGRDLCTGVSVDAKGAITMAGTFTDNILFEKTELVAPVDQASLFTARLDALGFVSWAKSFGGGPIEFQRALPAVDAKGNLVLAGIFNGSINFGGQDLVSQGVLDGNAVLDAFVAKLDEAGNHIASQRYGSDTPQGVFGLALAPSGDILVSGSTLGSMNIGAWSVGAPGPLVASPFVARLSR